MATSLLSTLTTQPVRSVTALLALGRSAYSFFYFAIGLFAAAGNPDALSVDPNMAQIADRLSPMEFGIWVTYATAYAVTGVLLLMRNRWAVVAAVAAVLLDFGYWIAMPLSNAYSDVTATADGVLDFWVNGVNLAILAGAVYLELTRKPHGDTA